MTRYLTLSMTALLLLALTACETPSMSMPAMPSMGSVTNRKDPLEKRAEAVGKRLVAAAGKRRVSETVALKGFKDVASFARHVPDQLDAIGPDLEDGTVSASSTDSIGDDREVTHRLILMGKQGDGVIVRLRYDRSADAFHVVSLAKAY